MNTRILSLFTVLLVAIEPGVALDQGCPRMLHRPIRAAGALRNERCGK